MDLFTFVQRYSEIEEGAGAVLYGAADVFTLGLWEVVGTDTWLQQRNNGQHGSDLR